LKILAGAKGVRLVVLLSFVANVVGLTATGYVIHGRGGVAYLRAVVTHNPSANPDPYYEFRTKLFEISKIPSKPIVFLGDSLTDQGEWQELFGFAAPVLNRGIGGDTSVGVLHRIEQITALKPQAVFLMIGTNDGQLIGFSPADTARTCSEIVKALHRDSPETRIYIEAILPTSTPRFNAWEQEANTRIAALADNRAIFFVDFRDRFTENGMLAKRLSSDGIHLSAEGYQTWKSALDPIVAGLLMERAQT
jgi:lysophospholipase L1-like esterase